MDAGDLHTGLLEERFDGWTGEAVTDTDLALAVAAIAEAGRRSNGAGNRRTEETAVTPWDTLGRFRLNGLD